MIIVREYVLGKLKSSKIYLLGLFFIITSCHKNAHLLPEGHNITTTETFSTAISYGRILKIKTPIKLENLEGYPKDYKKNITRTKEKTLTHWIRLDNLTDKEGVIANVRQTLDFGDNEQVEGLLKQIEIVDNEIYFAGLGDVMKGSGNKTHNVYQFMYFLNLKTNKIYELDDIH